jgi:hypothetical protein
MDQGQALRTHTYTKWSSSPTSQISSPSNNAIKFWIYQWTMIQMVKAEPFGPITSFYLFFLSGVTLFLFFLNSYVHTMFGPSNDF